MIVADFPRSSPVEPWDLSFAARAELFWAEPVRVAYYYHEFDTSTFRFRCFNMARAINSHAPGIAAGWFCQQDGDDLLDIVKAATVLVIGRSRFTDFAAKLIAVARQYSVPVFFDVDDFVFEPSAVPKIVSTLGVRRGNLDKDETTWNYWFAYVSRVRALLDLTDEVIVTNEYFAERTREVVRQPVRVVPNFMGQEQLDYSATLAAVRDSSADRSDGKFHFGYFSGTPTHKRDFAIVVDALAELMRQDDAVHLRIVGFMDIGDTPLAGFAQRVERIPLTDYMDLQRRIAEVEVNIAPLQNNEFTNCKSELKYFDAAAVGVPTFASPTYTMSLAIDDGVNGRLVADDDWFSALSGAVQDPSGMRAMGRVARDSATSIYTPEAQVAGILSALKLDA